MKLAIITGGSRGLGETVVHQLIEKGWFVRELSRSGTSKYHIDADLSDSEQIKHQLNTLLNSIKTVEVTELLFVHNAAVLEPIRKFEKISEEDFLRHSNINVISPTILVQIVMNTFRDFNITKTLVNISSGAALKAHAGWSLYCMGKAAMENFFNAIYLEELEQQYPFKIINYDPSIMDTVMQKEIRNSKREDFPELERFLNFKTDGKLSKPSDVARDLIRVVEGCVDRVRYKYGNTPVKG